MSGGSDAIVGNRRDPHATANLEPPNPLLKWVPMSFYLVSVASHHNIINEPLVWNVTTYISFFYPRFKYLHHDQIPPGKRATTPWREWVLFDLKPTSFCDWLNLKFIKWSKDVEGGRDTVSSFCTSPSLVQGKRSRVIVSIPPHPLPPQSWPLWEHSPVINESLTITHTLSCNVEDTTPRVSVATLPRQRGFFLEISWHEVVDHGRKEVKSSFRNHKNQEIHYFVGFFFDFSQKGNFSSFLFFFFCKNIFSRKAQKSCGGAPAWVIETCRETRDQKRETRQVQRLNF